jgi:hypothetical protein
MQRVEVSGAVRPIKGSLDVKGVMMTLIIDSPPQVLKVKIKFALEQATKVHRGLEV